MTKYWMLSAAAVLSSVTAAQATQGVYCFNFGSTGGGSYCDGGVVYTGIDNGAAGNAFRSWTYLGAQCGGQNSSGVGLAGKSPVLGKVSLMSNNIAANYGSNFEVEYVVLPEKFKNGKPWSLWVGFSGTTFFEGNHGPLIDVSNCQNRTEHRGRPSAVTKVRELVRLRRNAKDGVASP